MVRDEIQIKAERDYAVEEASKVAFEKGQAEGKAKGRAEGKAEGKAEVAKALKEMNIAINDIVRATGLSKDQIEALGN